MASTLVEIMPSSERTLVTVVEDNQHMSIDDLCLSVNSISLTENSAVEKVSPQIVNDEHHVVDSADRYAAKTNGIDKQSRMLDEKLDGKLDVRPIDVILVQHQTKEGFMTILEKEETEGWKVSPDSRTENEDTVEKLAECVEEKDRNGSAKHAEDGIGILKVRQCIPQEHDETSEESDEPASEIVARGPIGGIPVTMPGYGQPFLQPGCFPAYPEYGSQSAPKYRKPPPQYVPPATYVDPPAIMLSPLMSGGHVFIHNPACGDASQMQPVVRPPVIDHMDNDVNNDIDDFLQNPISISAMSSGDFDGIMISSNDDNISHTLPVPTEIPPVPVPFTGNGSPGFPPAVSATNVDVSQMLDEYSDCISPGSAWSPQNSPAYSAMSPCSTADSGLAGEDDLDTLLEVLSDDLKRNHQRHASGQESHSTGNPHPVDGNPRRSNPSGDTHYPGNPAQNHMGLQTVVQLIPPCTVPSVVTTASPVPQVPVTCIIVSPVTTQPVAEPRFREILPRPPDMAQDSRGLPDSTSTGLLTTFM